MKKLIIIVTIMIITLSLLFFRMIFSNDAREFYYVRIDNTKIETLGSRKGVIDFNGGMEYGYTLTGYNERGEKKSVFFGANRRLKDGAFLKLSVVPVRGVTEWEEVIFEEMPEAVRKKFRED